ncbi:MAG: DUF2851 family protein [Sphingobacteriales bacterium]|nr:MAG: DUF2851 family protein [Sphingobacteriales bacterium]
MTERLLQYIWQMQLFNKTALATTQNEILQIFFPGQYNTNQGPDFSAAKIKIDNTILVGNVEVHTLSSDWKTHKHNDDINYKNIILHVVWEDDKPLPGIPTLVLKNRVSGLLLNKYEELMNNRGFIPCERSIALIKSLTWQSWKERLLVERLQRKSAEVLSLLKQSGNHWEETFWWLLAGNFGVKVNKECFESIAQSVSINILAKHKNSIQQLEAILLGQAGMLNGEFTGDYPKLLQREYKFCQNKYQLQPVKIPPLSLRMRPTSFPAVRLAQLAMLVHQSLHLFSKIKEAISVNEIRKLLDITANDYWHYHYSMDEPSAYKPKHLGGQMIDNILINTVIPLLFAYGQFHKEHAFKDKAIKWLGEIKPEQNNITRPFTQLGIENKSAFDSQSLLELKKHYCDKKRCLNCAVGNSLLKKSTS